jgi:hypothetical protein
MLKKLSCTLGRGEKATQGNHYLDSKAAPKGKGSPAGGDSTSPTPPAAPQPAQEASAAAEKHEQAAQEKPKKAQHWVFYPTYSRIMLSIVLFLCSTLWIFVMGFWIGTNQNPNETVQALTGMSQEKSTAQALAQSASPTEAAKTAPETKPQAEKNSKEAAPVAKAEQNKAQSTAQAESPAPKNAPTKKAEEKKSTASTAPQYNYIFQVATFKASEEDNISALRAKLEAENLRVQVKGKQLRQVLVLLRGSDADAAELRALCGKLRLGAPMMRKRELIKPKGN